MYTPPEFDDALRHLATRGVSKIIALPMFPHYSIATTQSAYNLIHHAQQSTGLTSIPLSYINSYYDHPTYIRALTSTIKQGVAKTGGEGPIHLIFSAHGLPVSYVQKRLDPYADQIEATIKATITALAWKDPYHLAWQSRLGPIAWLRPSTEEMLDTLARNGAKRVTIIPLSFVCDHFETLDEIDIGLAKLATQLKISHFTRAPALNLNSTFISCLKELIVEALANPPIPQCPRCKATIDGPTSSCCAFRRPRYLSDQGSVLSS
jgi:protoporphyrin/coproporphyrin ferrochelatase